MENDSPLMRLLDSQLTNAQKARMDFEKAAGRQLWAIPIHNDPNADQNTYLIPATEEQPTMDSKDGTESGLDRGQLLLHTHELESRCLELRRQIATLRGHQAAGVREAVGEEMIYLAGVRFRLGT